MTILTHADNVVRTEPRVAWHPVIAGFIALIFGVNTVPVMFNFLASPLIAEFGWNRSDIAIGLAVFTVCDGLSMLAVGAMVDRMGVKSVIPMAFLFGGGICALAWLPLTLSAFHLVCGVIGLGAGATAPTVYSIVINAWFTRRRGLALGILNVGLGLCGTLMPFILNALLGNIGWRGTMTSIGIITLVLPLFNLLFVLRMPKGWDTAPRAAQDPKTSRDVGFIELLRSRHLWLVALSIFFVSAATYGLLSQMVSVTVDRGFDKTVAIAALSAISFSSVLSRIVVGALLDKLFAPILAAAIFVLTAAGVLLLAHANTTVGIYLSAVLVGVGLGAEGDIAAYILSRYVPKARYGRAFGLVMFLFAQGGAIGVFVLGKSFLAFGSYGAALNLIVGLVLLAAVLIACLGPYAFDVANHAEENKNRRQP